MDYKEKMIKMGKIYKQQEAPFLINLLNLMTLIEIKKNNLNFYYEFWLFSYKGNFEYSGFRNSMEAREQVGVELFEDLGYVNEKNLDHLNNWDIKQLEDLKELFINNIIYYLQEFGYRFNDDEIKKALSLITPELAYENALHILEEQRKRDKYFEEELINEEKRRNKIKTDIFNIFYKD